MGGTDAAEVEVIAAGRVWPPKEPAAAAGGSESRRRRPRPPRVRRLADVETQQIGANECRPLHPDDHPRHPPRTSVFRRTLAARLFVEVLYKASESDLIRGVT